jgi:hypothetical protein
VLSFLAAHAVGGCLERSSATTGLRVTTQWSGLEPDQLSFALTDQEGRAIGPRERRPAQPGGPLVSGTGVVVLLDEAYADRQVRCDVEAMAAGQVIGAGSGQAMVVRNTVVELPLTVTRTTGAVAIPDGGPEPLIDPIPSDAGVAEALHAEADPPPPPFTADAAASPPPVDAAQPPPDAPAPPRDTASVAPDLAAPTPDLPGPPDAPIYLDAPRDSGGSKPAGAPCQAGPECASGWCTSGVCCASASCGQCSACNVAGHLGTCHHVPTGTADPNGQCAAQPAASCGRDGTCDGAGQCRLHAADTVCAPASCEGPMLRGIRRCDGAGTCKAGPSQNCEPYQCDPLALTCLKICFSDAHCCCGRDCSSWRCQ